METTFKLWAPLSDAVTLNLYQKGHRASQLDDDGVAGVDTPYQTIPMVKGAKGVWQVSVTGDLDKVYYTFSVRNGLTTNEVVDPYAKAAGINGKRGMVVNFARTNPVGWNASVRPDTMDAYTDAIIYEIHVRDYTSHSTWLGNPEWRGKFLGLAQRGTVYNSVTTGLDHIIELGITHVQLVPVFDHGIIDETRLNDPTYYGIHDGIFNWGYMPENFNVLEGSYSTDPYNGEVRITEFKQMVQTFHDNDLPRHHGRRLQPYRQVRRFQLRFDRSRLLLPHERERFVLERLRNRQRNRLRALHVPKIHGRFARLLRDRVQDRRFPLRLDEIARCRDDERDRRRAPRDRSDDHHLRRTVDRRHEHVAQRRRGVQRQLGRDARRRRLQRRHPRRHQRLGFPLWRQRLCPRQ
ncbi:MAG: hypothetical protein MZU97_05945 [Bacillus subtilis]|nr:hypothetical protein [Bacillus subtilis]